MSAAVTPNLDSISLYYKDEKSDKEYHLAILGSEAEGFKVEYRYGKRGAKMQVRFKNPVPIAYAAARTLYESMRDAQLKDGYTVDVAGTAYVGTENQGRVSGVRPMLLGEIDEARALELINDDDWIMQEKKNGVRQMVKKEKKTIEGINKKGLTTSLPETTANAVKQAVGKVDALLDGELVGEVFWLFDMLSIGVHAFSDKPLIERMEGIQEWVFGDSLIAICDWDEYVKMVPTAVGKASKKALFAKLKADNAEGVVFKKKDSPYKAGRSDGALKFKFYATATVRVRSLNDKQSFQMEMLSKGDWTYVGNCTFYPTIYTPKPGDFVEVRYMYATAASILYGPPVLLEHRKDVDEGDCVMSQLKYKQGLENDDDDN